ncbi:MAG: HAMP domain-containing sensor histidine kinase [bacterium]
MSLRSLLACVFVFLVAAGAGLLWFFNASVLAQLPDPVTRDFVLVAAALFLSAFLVVIALALWFIAGRLARPLRHLAHALDVFAERGERAPLTSSSMSPREVRVLEHSFTDLADKVEAAHARDAQVSRVKSDFITTAAHQLRTPLTGIRWALEALQQTSLGGDQKQLVENATTKSKELVAIVKTLLDISSIESGKYNYKVERVDLAALVDEVVRDFAQLSLEKKVPLLYEGSGEQVPPVVADRERIKWVLTNLVENAIRYTPEGGSVRLLTDEVPGLVRILVRDTGIGILPKDRENIFERFFRGGNALAKENEGNGLGLYIARTIATDHGGDLAFEENKDGPGTTFIFSLPIAEASS